MSESASQGAADGLYLLQVAMQHYRHLLNEQREAMLTEPEWVALLDAYEEAGR